MPENIYLISGSKGGVGKSMVSVAAADYLLGQGKKVLVLDADEDSPDVAKICSGLAKTELVSLDGADGWIDMANMIYDAPGHAVVVNTAARNSAGMAACCAALAEKQIFFSCS
jgi:Mrp family chromosome partitioning ATPase